MGTNKSFFSDYSWWEMTVSLWAMCGQAWCVCAVGLCVELWLSWCVQVLESGRRAWGEDQKTAAGSGFIALMTGCFYFDFTHSVSHHGIHTTSTINMSDFYVSTTRHIEHVVMKASVCRHIFANSIINNNNMWPQCLAPLAYYSWKVLGLIPTAGNLNRSWQR